MINTTRHLGGVGEMAQLGKCVLHKHDLKLDPQHPHERRSWAQQSTPVMLGGRDGQMPGTCCSNSLPQSVGLGIKKKAHLQCRHTLLP